MNQSSFFLCLFLSFFVSPSAHGQEGGPGGEPSTGLPLPRFASLRVSEANLRAGPGTRYPIEWVYLREGVPLEIIAESEAWRRVRDWEGSEGWLHKSALSGKRTAIVHHGRKTMHKDESVQAPVVAAVEAGATGQILSCQTLWCTVRFGDSEGFMQKTDFWGAYAQETFD